MFGKHGDNGKMRKRGTALTAAAVLLALVLTASILLLPSRKRPVRAASQELFTLSRNEAFAGENITVTVRYDLATEVTGTMIVLEFGPNLTYVSSDKDGMLADTVDVSDVANRRITVLSAEGNGTGKATLCKIVLKVADNSPRDIDETVTARMVEYSDGDYNEHKKYLDKAGSNESADRDADADTHCDAHADRHAHPNADGDSYRYADQNAHRAAHGYAD